ncbi:MAG: hypothetical protein NVV59_17150 [Chitinophagaceae bacterium]|nr:hypothetical protein [Chitinophagaceae bacterium]
MRTDFHISTFIDEPALLENLVEKLASRHQNMYHPAQMITKDLQSMDTASTQTFVSGTLQFEKSEGQELTLTQTPFISQFYFTCICESDSEYGLEWGVSLS